MLFELKKRNVEIEWIEIHERITSILSSAAEKNPLEQEKSWFVLDRVPSFSSPTRPFKNLALALPL